MSQFGEKLVTGGQMDSTEVIGPSGYARGPIISMDKYFSRPNILTNNTVIKQKKHSINHLITTEQ